MRRDGTHPRIGSLVTLVPPCVAVLAALMLAGFSGWRAATPPQILPAPRSQPFQIQPLEAAPEGMPVEALLLAARFDPLDPERGMGAHAPAETPEESGAIRPLLVGTVASPGGGVAMLTGSSGGSRLVRVGDRYDGWLLERVEAGGARLRGAGGESVEVVVGGRP